MDDNLNPAFKPIVEALRKPPVGVNSTDLLYCDNCKHLKMTEKEQDTYIHFKKPQHRCGASGSWIKHCGQHPKLPKPPQCKQYEAI